MIFLYTSTVIWEYAERARYETTTVFYLQAHKTQLQPEKERWHTHTCTDVSTSLTHSWCDLNPNGMWWDSAALIGWRAGSEHIPQTFQITTPQTTNENHRHCRTEPIRVLAHDESSRDWINNGGWLKQPYQHCSRRQTKHLLSRNRFYTTRGGITSALWC